MFLNYANPLLFPLPEYLLTQQQQQHQQQQQSHQLSVLQQLQLPTSCSFGKNLRRINIQPISRAGTVDDAEVMTPINTNQVYQR
jgi:hypothetical protein